LRPLKTGIRGLLFLLVDVGKQNFKNLGKILENVCFLQDWALQCPFRFCKYFSLFSSFFSGYFGGHGVLSIYGQRAYRRLFYYCYNNLKPWISVYKRLNWQIFFLSGQNDSLGIHATIVGRYWVSKQFGFLRDNLKNNT